MFSWWSAVAGTDMEVVRAQLGKAPRSIVAVARRCRFGSPQVIVTNPVVLGPGRRSEKRAGVEANDLRVFPTTYWLTCPHLVTAVSRLEGEGLIGRLHAWLTDDATAAVMAAAHKRAAVERLALVDEHLRAKMQSGQPAQWEVLATAGVGGTRNQLGVKCLHSHLADYLAGPVGTQRLGENADYAPGVRNPIGAQVLAHLLQVGVDTTGWPGCTACQRPSMLETSGLEAPESQPCGKSSKGGQNVEHIAVMDVGTNSCRLLLTHFASGRLTRCYATLKTTRLGEGLHASGRLSPQAVQRTIDGLRALQHEAFAGAETAPEATPASTQTVVVATNAVRTSENPGDFLIRAWEELGLAVRVVTGEEEAALSFSGALSGMCNRLGAPKHSAVGVLDIGGGSTELVVGTWDGNLSWAGSVNIGAVRLRELMSQENDNIPALVQTAMELLQVGLNKGMQVLHQSGTLVGVGGTCTTLAAIDLGLTIYKPEMVQGHVLTLSRIQDIAAMLAEKSWKERQIIPGLQPERADIIVPGSAILLAFMQLLGQQQVIISDSDILLGTAQAFIKACFTVRHGV